MKNCCLLYLLHDLPYYRSIWCVEQFSFEQRFDSSPHNAGQRVGLQSVDQISTKRSCGSEKEPRTQSLSNIIL